MPDNTDHHHLGIEPLMTLIPPQVQSKISSPATPTIKGLLPKNPAYLQGLLPKNQHISN